MNSAGPARHLSIGELCAVVTAGGLHVSTELSTSLAVSRAYNIAVCVLFLGYIAWRLQRDPSLLRAWGLRTDNFRRALPAYSLFVVAGGAAIYAAGGLLGRVPDPAAHSLVLYLAWGLAQQFALQNLLVRNLAPMIANTWLSSALASLTFSASHVPRHELTAIACIGGFAFVLLYRRFPNLFAAGIAHGLLGWWVFGFLGLQ